MRTRYLTLDDFAIVIEEYRNFFRGHEDPLPDIKSCNFEKLDSIVAIPQKTYLGSDLYPTLFDKASCYFYFINKLHPFFNGNKRMSIFVTSIFFMMNNHELTYKDEDLYRFAHSITISTADQKSELSRIANNLKDHTTPITDAWAYLKQTWVLVASMFQNFRLQSSILGRQNSSKEPINL
jgi:death on curing protein